MVSSAAPQPVVVGIGEILWDDLPSGRFLGGAPANFAYHAGTLGADAVIVSAVGDDEAGKDILETLRRHGMRRDHVSVIAAVPTGRVTAASLGTVVPSRERIEEGVRTLQGRVAVKSPEAEMRLLKRALDVELETGAFYARVVNELPPEGRRLFEPFLVIERGHQAIVQAEMNAVSGNGFWFDFPEINLEG